MSISGVNDFLHLKVVLKQLTTIGAVEDSGVEWTPLHAGDQVVLWRLDHLVGFGLVVVVSIASLSETLLQVEDADERLLTLTVMNHAEVRVTVVKFHLLGHHASNFNRGDHISIGSVEDLDSVSSGSRQEMLAILGHVHRLARVVDLEQADSLQIVGVVHADGLIIRAGEE